MNPIFGITNDDALIKQIQLVELAVNVISQAQTGRPISHGTRFPHQTWLPIIASTPQFPIAAKFRISQTPLFPSHFPNTHHFPNFSKSSSLQHLKIKTQNLLLKKKKIFFYRNQNLTIFYFLFPHLLITNTQLER